MKKILVTGASAGLGLGMVTALGAGGHTVYAGVLNQDELNNFQKLENVTPLVLDVTNNDDIEKVKILIEKDGLDVLINNAGISIGGPLLEVSMEEMQKQFSVNVFAHISMIQALRDLLIESKGHIINISSVNGHVASPYAALYSMSKFAIESMNESLRVELKDFGIRVTTINPGLYLTGMLFKLRDIYNDKADKTVYYKELYKKMKDDDTDLNTLGRDVSIIGADILDIVNSDTPPDRFISGTDEEKKMLYDTNIERLRNIMKTSSDTTLEQYLEDLKE